MSKDRRWIGYLITALIGLGIAVIVFFGRGGFDVTGREAFLGLMCDAFFVPGIVLGSVGVLVWVADDGFFDIFSYGFNSLLVLFSPLRKPEKHQRYYDYKIAKAARRKKASNVVLWVGLAYLALAGLCLAGYMFLPA